MGCVTICWSRSFHEPCQVLLNKWLVYCTEAKASLTACLHYCLTQPALLERERAALLSRITVKCMFRIKREMTWPCLSWSTTDPVNPVRAALQRSRLAPAGLVLIQVHILNRTRTNDQILCGINNQASRFNQQCIALKELSYSLISYVVPNRQRSDIVTSYPAARWYQEGAYDAL